MHTYKRTRDGDSYLWVVGYYRPLFEGKVEWVPLSDHSSELDAIQRVNMLNGGECKIYYPTDK